MLRSEIRLRSDAALRVDDAALRVEEAALFIEAPLNCCFSVFSPPR